MSAGSTAGVMYGRNAAHVAKIQIVVVRQLVIDAEERPVALVQIGIVREEPNVVVAQVRVGGIHVVAVHDGLRRAIDAVRRNDIAGERRVRRRILDGRKLREIAGPLQRGRHGLDLVGAERDSLVHPAHKEERTVLDNAPADLRFEFVEQVRDLFRGRNRVLAGIQRVVLVLVVGVAVEIVAAVLGNHVEASGAAAVHIGVHGGHLDRLVEVGIVHLIAAGVVGNAIKGVGLLVPVGDARKHHRPAVALDVRHGGHQGKWRWIDIHEGSGRILLGRVQLSADGAGFGLNQRGAGFHRDRFRGRPHFQRDLQAAHLPGVEQHVLGDEGTEARSIRLHTVSCRLEVWNLIISIRIAYQRANLDVGLDFGYGDVGSGNRCSRGVFDDPTQYSPISLRQQHRPGKQTN